MTTNPDDLWSLPPGTVVVVHDDESLVVTLERDINGLWYSTGNNEPILDSILDKVAKFATNTTIIPPPKGWKG